VSFNGITEGALVAGKFGAEKFVDFRRSFEYIFQSNGNVLMGKTLFLELWNSDVI
jgi:hypothetical protein